MTTTEPDLNALALELASAKTWCGTCDGGGKIKVPQYEGQKETCPTCNGTGEVYILDDEVRVKCQQLHTIVTNSVARVATCEEAKCRGWNPLDLRLGWDWMVAVEKAGYQIFSSFHTYSPKWEFEIGQPPEWIKVRADTPGEAFFAAAVKALGLNTEEE